MAKKDKRRHQRKEPEPTADIVRGILRDDPPVPAAQKPYDPPPPANRPLPLSLADIRNEALRQHANVAHTIADLEAWAAEIASTIAFLKARDQ